jgi:hypothetical protein
MGALIINTHSYVTINSTVHNLCLITGKSSNLRCSVADPDFFSNPTFNNIRIFILSYIMFFNGFLPNCFGKISLYLLFLFI